MFSNVSDIVPLIFMNLISDLTEARMKKIDSDLQGLIPIDAPVTLDTDHSLKTAENLREFYLGGQAIAEDSKAQYANV